MGIYRGIHICIHIYIYIYIYIQNSYMYIYIYIYIRLYIPVCIFGLSNDGEWNGTKIDNTTGNWDFLMVFRA